MRSFPAINRAPTATQHPATPLPFYSNLHTGKPSSLVRGPFQESLFSMAVVGHLLKRDKHPVFISVWREGGVEYAL